jgi:flagellar biosynthesis protein FlhA
MPSSQDPLHLAAIVRAGQPVLAEPLSLEEGARVRLVLWREDGEGLPPPPGRLELMLGEALVTRAMEELVPRVRSLRASFLRTRGVRIPPVHIADDLRLEPDAWTLSLDQRVLVRGRVQLGRVMMLATEGAPLPEVGLPGVDPTFGLPVRWVTPAERAPLANPALLFVEPLSVVATSLEEVVRFELPSLYGLAQLDEQLSALPPALPRAMAEVGVGRGRLLALLRRVATEGRSVALLEALLEAAVLSWQAASASEPAAADEACLTALLARFPAVEE